MLSVCDLMARHTSPDRRGRTMCAAHKRTRHTARIDRQRLKVDTPPLPPTPEGAQQQQLWQPARSHALHIPI